MDIREFQEKIKESFENNLPYKPNEDDIELLENVVKALEEAAFQSEHQSEYGYHEILNKVNKVLKK